MIEKTMKAKPSSDLEAVIVEAECVAATLEKSSERSARLFARVLLSLSNDARCAILAESAPETLMRLHLRIETTMRLADADDAGAARAESLPPSQRPTIRCPPTIAPHDDLDVTFDVPVIPSASSSQVRRRTGWAELADPSRRRINARGR
jgi:hypothetical protein